MAIKAYIGGTTGLKDGVLEIPNNKVGLSIPTTNGVGTLHFRAGDKLENAIPFAVPAPKGCEVSKDGVNWFTSVSFAAGEVGPSNVPCHFKNIMDEAYRSTGIATLPRLFNIPTRIASSWDVTPPSFLGPVNVVNGLDGTGDCLVEWPEATDDSAVLGYDVALVVGSVVTTIFVEEPTASFNDLPMAVEHLVKVRAVDIFENKSNWIEQSFTLPRGIAAPTNLQAATYDKRIDLSWTLPIAARQSVLITYSADGEDPTTIALAGSSTSRSFVDLVNGVEYTFVISCIDMNGVVGDVAVISAVPNIGEAPVLFGVVDSFWLSDTSIQLIWPEATDNIEVAEYEVGIKWPGTVSYMPKSGPHLTNTTIINSLYAQGIYEFRVRAKDSDGNVSSWIYGSAATAGI